MAGGDIFAVCLERCKLLCFNRDECRKEDDETVRDEKQTKQPAASPLNLPRTPRLRHLALSQPLQFKAHTPCPAGTTHQMRPLTRASSASDWPSLRAQSPAYAC
ncbi:hypothetical protein K458DRAFT_128757 [Lentithecium fluviatile CBS 122367]|uniref:Uncharacterized protein n=1 Tax=Lentithecium fluviatile CBS 122367 TaxID=1168545 RepID=A0A6G1JH11_9PLEO|nr:hypothetical protein K458DRAFT_128757 [Lentithecium fluviatile CBS 122367]